MDDQYLKRNEEEYKRSEEVRMKWIEEMNGTISKSEQFIRDFCASSEQSQYKHHSQYRILLEKLEKMNSGVIGLTKKRLDDQINKLRTEVGRPLANTYIEALASMPAGKKKTKVNIGNEGKSKDGKRKGRRISVTSKYREREEKKQGKSR